MFFCDNFNENPILMEDNLDRKCQSEKRSQQKEELDDEPIIKKTKVVDKTNKLSPAAKGAKETANQIIFHQHQSPKKRLQLPHGQAASNSKAKEKFIYGNYSKYYGYRNKGKDFHDIRLDVFKAHKTLFKDKVVLDIGCNSGFITLELAKLFSLKHITGLDIDRSLIGQATKHVSKQKKAQSSFHVSFPFNITFLHGNYVLRDDVLLEIERQQFDLILCLSVTKWIHLNFGDNGLKQTFRRMFLQLRPGGQLILEAQPFDNYGRRKKMTETIFNNYKSMQFFPKDFTNYLLSSEVGFKSVSLIGVPDHCIAGFKRPIQIFNKD